MTARPPSQRAGILSNDVTFQRFAATRSGFPEGQFCAGAAAEYIRQVCKVESRRELDRNPEAARQFARLRTTFDAWAGRLAAQR